MTPFEVLAKDIDDFIIISNYLLTFETDIRVETPVNNISKETRIRVNDKTASGGWF